jgi:uncharacterized membrane protein
MIIFRPSDHTTLLTSFVCCGFTSPKLLPLSTSQHAVTFTLIFKNLAVIFHFLHKGALLRALEVLFGGSYMVLQRVDKMYMVEIHAVAQKMSNCRLKSAHNIHFNFEIISQPAILSGTTTCSWNSVRFLPYLVVQVSLQGSGIHKCLTRQVATNSVRFASYSLPAFRKFEHQKPCSLGRSVLDDIIFVI